MKLLDIFLGNPLFIGAVAGLGLAIGGVVAEVAILTTLGGILLGLTVGGVAIMFATIQLCGGNHA